MTEATLEMSDVPPVPTTFLYFTYNYQRFGPKTSWCVIKTWIKQLAFCWIWMCWCTHQWSSHNDKYFPFKSLIIVFSCSGINLWCSLLSRSHFLISACNSVFFLANPLFPSISDRRFSPLPPRLHLNVPSRAELDLLHRREQERKLRFYIPLSLVTVLLVLYDTALLAYSCHGGGIRRLWASWRSGTNFLTISPTAVKTFHPCGQNVWWSTKSILCPIFIGIFQSQIIWAGCSIGRKPVSSMLVDATQTKQTS